MALSRRIAAPIVFFLVLLVAAEMGAARVVAEERHCLSQSHMFKGLCMSSNNCASVCMAENFVGGECKLQGATRKCFCKKLC